MKIFFLFFFFNLYQTLFAYCVCRLPVFKTLLNKHPVENPIPWQVSISENDQHLCSGAIINKNFILVLKDCVINKSLNDLYVLVGLNGPDEPIAHKIKKIEILNEKNQEFMILKLNKPIKLIRNKISKACFKNLDDNNDLLIASSWINPDLKTFEISLNEDKPLNKFSQQVFFNNNDGSLKRTFVNKKFDSLLHQTNNGRTHIIGILNNNFNFKINNSTKLKDLFYINKIDLEDDYFKKIKNKCFFSK